MSSRIIVVGLVIFCMAAESRSELHNETPEIFAEGLSSNATNHVKTSRIVGRKGAENPHQEDNSATDKSLESTAKQIESAENASNASTKELSPTERVSIKPSGLNDSSAISDVQKHQLLLSTAPPDTTTAKITAILEDINQSSGSKQKYIILCISLALTVLVIALASVMYRKIRNWIELRHYTRVVSLRIIVQRCLQFKRQYLYFSSLGLFSGRDIRQLKEDYVILTFRCL